MPDRERRPSTLPQLPTLLVLAAGAWFAASALNAAAGLAIAPTPAIPELPPAPAAPPPSQSVSPEQPRARPQPPRPGVEVERIVVGLKELEGLYDPGDLAAPARFVPEFAPGGALRGVRIDHIQPASWPELLGIENGDVMTRIDDERIGLAGHGPDFSTRLREHTLRSVEVERGARTLRKELVFAEP
jgi:hypothetical protein